MGEILGIGSSHAPALMTQGNMCARFKRMMEDPRQRPDLRDPQNWPAEAREQWNDDEGLAFSDERRELLISGFRKIRTAIDEFNPDLLVIWGDDQYENFQEDIVPPFCVIASDEFEAKPWERGRAANSWNEPPDKQFHFKGNRAAGKFLATSLLEQGFDISYAYKPLHHHMSHAFLNVLLFLDWDRQGWKYPILPFHINCIGRTLVVGRGGAAGLGGVPQEAADFDPPAPSPGRCFDVGAATARALLQSPWRVLLYASGAWSHGQLTAKNSFLWSDTETDRKYHDALVRGDYDLWRNRPLADVEATGHQEVLNWHCLVGAMSELDRRVVDSELLEGRILNGMAFAVFDY